MRLLTFSEWQEQMMALATEIDCPLCGGNGHWIKECDECGNDAEMYCHACDEDYKCIPAGYKWDYDERQEAFGFHKYKQALCDDITALYKFTGRLPTITEPRLNDRPFYCEMRTRRIAI